MQTSVRAEADKAVDIDPLARIKSELPEFCTLVASARARARDGNDVDSVIESMRTLVALLLTVPEKDMLPTPNQRYGLDGFVYGTHASAMAYAQELDEHSRRVRKATKEFLEAERDMLEVRERVRNEYASTLSGFESLVMDKETSDGVDLGTILNDFLTGDISFSPCSKNSALARGDDKEESEPPQTPSTDSLSSDTDSSDEDEDSPEEITRASESQQDNAANVRLTVIEDSPLSLHSFFTQNNTTIISPNVDASTSDPFISVALSPLIAHAPSRLLRQGASRSIARPAPDSVNQ